jgi:cytochrome c biogenesis protein CcmG, thiol:disulfide interchange protein DsbE
MSSESPSSSMHAKPRKSLSWVPLLFIGVGILLLIGLLVVILSQPETQALVPPRVGASLGNFSLPDLQGKNISLSDFTGKVVLVNAWATWCPPCRAEMPALNTYFQAHQQDGFVVLAVNAGEAQADAAAFARDGGLAFPVLLDTDYHLLDGLNIHDYPTSIVIGRDGQVKAIHIGMYSTAELEAEVNPLLLP